MVHMLQCIRGPCLCLYIPMSASVPACVLMCFLSVILLLVHVCVQPTLLRIVACLQVAVQEVRRLQKYGVTSGELERYKAALIRDSEHVAEQRESVPSVDTLDYCMECLALNHTFMSPEDVSHFTLFSHGCFSPCVHVVLCCMRRRNAIVPQEVVSQQPWSSVAVFLQRTHTTPACCVLALLTWGYITLSVCFIPFLLIATQSLIPFLHVTLQVKSESCLLYAYAHLCTVTNAVFQSCCKRRISTR